MWLFTRGYPNLPKCLLNLPDPWRWPLNTIACLARASHLPSEALKNYEGSVGSVGSVSFFCSVMHDHLRYLRHRETLPSNHGPSIFLLTPAHLGIQEDWTRVKQPKYNPKQNSCLLYPGSCLGLSDVHHCFLCQKSFWGYTMVCVRYTVICVDKPPRN